MTEPVIAGYKSKKVNLVKGEEYYWCSCGKSQNQPFCDGSHKGSTFTPVKFIAQQDGEVGLCMCKHTKNQPFCDGTHRGLPQDLGVV